MPKKGEVLHPVTGCRMESNLFANPWLMDDRILESYRAQISQVSVQVMLDAKQKVEAEAAKVEADRPSDQPPPKPYQVHGGTAIVPINGVMTKYSTSMSALFGGTSTLRVQRQLSLAVADSEVERIILRIDSPGGNVDGTFDLANAIAKADKKKPVIAQAEDQCASGAQLLASQCRYTFANENAQMGSIGVLSRLVDSSKAAEASGVTVHRIATGKKKGIGMHGVPVTGEDVKAVQANADQYYALFRQKVAAGRGITEQSIDNLEAGWFIASEAKQYGLIDDVQDFETTLANVKAGKYDEPVNRSPVASKPGATGAGVTPARRTGMLSEQQLAAARALPGATGITAENADSTLLQVATNLHQQIQSDQPLPANMAAGYVNLFMGGVELQVKNEKLTPAQAGVIEKYLYPQGRDKVPNTACVQKDGKVLLPADVVTSVLEANEPKEITKERTSAQPAVRTEPGAGGKPQEITLESLNKTRETNGLAPLTQAEFNAKFKS